MERSLQILLVLVSGAHGACPDSSWRENSATGKCYKIVPGYVGHLECATSCGAAASAASLACVKDEQDDKYIQDWLRYEGIPGTPRKIAWVGNYLASSGWSQCSNGQSSSFVNWTNPAADSNVPEMTNGHGPCVLVSDEGWYAFECIRWYHCLCESGTATSATYQAWTDSNMGEWMAPWVLRGTLTLVVAAVLGLTPLVFHLLCPGMFRTWFPDVAQGDWKARVKARVSFVMSHTGWLFLCLGFVPVIAFFIGLHAVYVIGYPQIWGAFVPLGVSCWLLAISPTNSNKCALISAIVFFSLFALVGLLAIILWLFSWVSGLIMGAVFFIVGTASAAILGHALCTLEDGRKRNKRLWASMRFFFLILFFVSLWLFIDYMVFLNSQFSENIGWVLLGLSALLNAILTRPPWRVKFCIWLSSMSHKVGDRKDAVDAAMLVWTMLDNATADEQVGTQLGGKQVPA